jgi:tetratricopeptide (TPR) repeat protein
MKSLIHEIHRRSLWQILAIFIGASWFVLEVIDVFIQRGMVPDWAFTGALLLLLIGLPIVLATAFVQEGHPGKAARDAHEAGVDEEVESREPAEGMDQPAPIPARPSLTGRLTWNKALLGGVLAFAALGVIAAGYMAMRTLGIGSPGTLVAQGLLEEGAEVILADFDSPSDPELGEVVTEALRIDLFQSPTFRVLERSDLSAGLQRMQWEGTGSITAELATELAEREGYKAVIAGDVGTAGSGYVLTARVLGGDGWRSLAAFRQTAKSEDDLIQAIEKLSKDIRDKAGESLRTVQGGPSLERVSTSSLAALRAYTQGVEHGNAEDNESALEAYERAVELDSTFAMAYRKIGVILSNMRTRRGDQIRVATRAYELRDRLSERERNLSEGWYHAQVSGDAEAAIRAYQRAIEVDSMASTPMNNLGNLYQGAGRFAEAEDLYARAVKLETFAVGWQNLARTRFWQGRFAEAEATLDSAIALMPDADLIRAWKVSMVGSAGDRARFDSLLVDYNARATGDFDRDVGRQLSRQAAGRRGQLQDSESQLAGFRSQAFRAPLDLASERAMVMVQRGDTAAAISLIRETLEVSRDSVDAADRDYWPVVNALWEAGAGPTADAVLEEWIAAVPAENLGLLGRTARGWATAQVAMLNGELDEAIRILENLRSECPGACDGVTSYILARAFELMGDETAAIAEYERHLAHNDSNRGFSGTILEQPHAIHSLAVLYDTQEDLENAAKYYAMFVELWAEADEELQPRVRAAQARLEAILRERG